MFGKAVEAGLWVEEKAGWMRRYVPKVTSFKVLRHFNFILLHYLYILSLVIIGSVVMYGIGGLAYIDALFFASGAATQSGLNTVDLRDLFLSQQIFLVLVSCIANPIWINTMVVFIRLYWFEKRFQNVVRDARTWRRTRTKSRTKSEMKQELDYDGEERGVGDREIQVLRVPNGDATMNGSHTNKEDKSSSDSPRAEDSEHQSDSNTAKEDGRLNASSVSPKFERPSTFQRDIMFADEVMPSKIKNQDRIPQQRTREESIKFVENQRNPKDNHIIHVPGPRDFDRGERPRQVHEADMDRAVSRDTDDDETEPEKPVSPDEANGHNRDNESLESESESEPEPRRKNLRWVPQLTTLLSPRRSRSDTTENGGDNDHGMHLRRRGRTRTLTSFLSTRSQERADRDPMPYLSYTATIGRNSLFVDLTEEQREELGGVEYRALKTLAWILSIYYIGFHAFGMVCLVPWILTTSYKSVPEAVSIAPTWWGFFTAMSLFNDLGFTLTPDSMISFQSAIFVMLLGSFLIVIGNTGFPCMLRFVIWATVKVVPSGSALYEELRFLLDHPRRCFTLLFPKQATWWLFWILVILNSIDTIFFIILDLNDPTVTSLPPGIRLVAGVFQAFSTRTAGFSSVNLAELHPAIQVSYLIMMYISVFPIAISIRRTNVYEEKSLGVYGSPSDDDTNSDGQEKSYISSHLRRQLSFDLWYVFLGLFIICIIEGNHLENINDYAFTVFSVLFEIVSAYGTVGLSLGYPDSNTSFSGQFSTLSKLIIIAMQLRGRHRGLPYALDRAILLPSESLQRKEAEEAARRAVARRGTSNDLDSEPLSATRTRRNSTGSMEMPERKPTYMSLASGKKGLKRIVSGAMSAGPARHKHPKNA